MREAIEFELIGQCRVIRPLAKKKWNMLCHIVKFQDKYTIIEYSLKGKRRKLKVSISKEDAEWLIDTLKLKYVPAELFANSGSYLQC